MCLIIIMPLLLRTGQALEDNQKFSFADDNNFTLTHLACAVGAKDVVARLSHDGRVFSSKDHDGMSGLQL